MVHEEGQDSGVDSMMNNGAHYMGINLQSVLTKSNRMKNSKSKQASNLANSGSNGNVNLTSDDANY